MEYEQHFKYKTMPLFSAISTLFAVLSTSIAHSLSKMSKFVIFVFSLILAYLPASYLINKSLSPCGNVFVTTKPAKSQQTSGLFKEIDENSAKKVQFFSYIGQLKHLERAGWVMNQIPKPETVAGHMHRMSLFAMMLDEDELKKTYGADFDLNKVIKITLIHDIAETITGDYTPYDKIDSEKKKQLELEAMRYLASYLPAKQASLLTELFDEYEERKSPESILAKEIDRLDLVLQAFEYEKSEFQRTGSVPDFEEFFDFNFVLSKIHNDQLKELVASIMKQRSAFLKSVCDKKSDKVVEQDSFSD